MKISTKGRYGLEALADLAFHSEGEPVSLREVARRCSLSQTYILQIFLILRRAGFVKSIRGVQGGYVLGAPPEGILLLDVLEALEGPLVPEDFLSGDGQERGFWEGLACHMKEALSSLTLEDVLECCRSLPVREPGRMDFVI